MSEFYDDLAATSADLLEELGQAVTFTSKTVGTYDPNTGTVSSTPAASTVSAVVLPIGKAFGQPDGNLVLVTDERVLLAPADASGAAIPKPQPGDTVQVGSVVLRVIQARTYSPAGTIVLHDLQVRV